MKNYGIYQSFIRTNESGPVQLLIAFTKAESREKALDNYTSNEFVRGYLSVKECSGTDYYKDELVKAISKNRHELGRWVRLIEGKGKIDNIVLSGYDINDHPDYANVSIESADYDGKEMTEFEIDEINEDSDYVYDQVIDQYLS